MALSIYKSQMPFIYDIPARDLWIAPTCAVGAYVLPHLMRKIFPLKPDNGPLSTVRYQFAQVHRNMKVKQPGFYHFLHVDVKDNLHYSVFIVTLYVLKKENQDMKNNKLVVLAGVLTSCIVGTFIRGITNIGFSSLAHLLRKYQLEKTAAVFQKLAVLIAPSEVTD